VGADSKYDILPVSVGTDPNLTLKTRRGMFGHSGWCATLEDWFDPRHPRQLRFHRLQAHGTEKRRKRPHLRRQLLPKTRNPERLPKNNLETG
jgi:hypothetical protein